MSSTSESHPQMAHTILLCQPTTKMESRTFWDFETVKDALEYICHMYDQHLMKANPNSSTITYDVTELFDYIDSLTDLSCLVFQRPSNQYTPFSKDWIKENIFVLLKQEAKKKD